MGNYAIKVFKEGFRYNFLKEVKFLTLLQPFKFVPELYFIDFENLRIVMKRISGLRISDHLDGSVIEQCLNCCFILDMLGIEKQEMNHPDKHIIIADRVYFIDFERGRFKNKPSNLTQFCVYLMRKGVAVNRELMVKYKKNPNLEIFERIRSEIAASSLEQK
ncbi:hypothetical protein [Archaeoglobus sp.]